MKKLLLLLVVVSFSAFAFAGSQTIDFEQYSAFTQITNQYSGIGVSFTNALQLVAPSYDYFDYPPHSGSGVITNDPDSLLTMTFAPGSAGFSVTGWFSSPSGMTATAYDSHGNVLATFAASTSLANMAFALNANTYIAYVTFDDALGTDGLTLDDISFTPVPEPATPMVLSSGLLAFGFFWRRKLSLLRRS